MIADCRSRCFGPLAGKGFALGLLLWSVCAANLCRGDERLVGQTIADFTLRDFRGAEHALSDMSDSELVVVAFLGTECPLAKLYAPRLEELQEAYAARGVAFLGINANQQDSNTELLHYARVHEITFPLLKDLSNEIADRFDARRTPEVFVLDAERVVRYRGRIDNQYEVGTKRAEATQHDLAEALDALLAGEEVPEPITDAPGCLIGRVREVDPKGDVTWSNQISRLFQEHCQSCHRPGQIGPFPLLEYDDVAGWAEMIQEVVHQKRMPPWNANPEYGEFSNVAVLSEEELSLIDRWVAAGAPEGDPAELPSPVKFTEGWQIPEPDQVIYIADEPFTVPAEGVVDYQWFTVDPGWDEDKWITMVECRPGNPAVVHHVTVYFKPPYVDWDLPLGDRINLLGGFAPGKKPVNLEEFDGTARYVPAGSQLVFEMHYTPNGSVQTDRSGIAVVFADPSEVRRQLSMVMVANTEFEIPPHESNHVVESRYTFDEDSLLYSLSPHMHLRGDTFRFVAHYPDGGEEILLEVPNFDFNWQFDYLLSEPKVIPRGTVMQCTATFDNSEDNIANPDPDKAVQWGDQIWEEMMIGTIAIAPLDQNLKARTGKPLEIGGTYRWAAVWISLLTVGMLSFVWMGRHAWRRFFAVALLAAVASCGCGEVVAEEVAASDSRIGMPIDGFTLQDFQGGEHSLSDWAERPAVVVAFLGTECPLAKLYAGRLVELSEKYASQNVAFVGIFSNRQDSIEEMEHFARVHGVSFPCLKDVGNQVADKFQAERTPEVYVLDEIRKVRYVGRVDDQYDVGVERSEPEQRFLVDAIDAMLADKEVPVPATSARGCIIGRVRQADENAEVTWSEQIARIFQRRCQNCHRPGEIAPFSLLEYDEAVGWAEMIGEVVTQRRMPPWYADPEHGEFVNDSRLTEEEYEQILSWVAAGAPEGDPSTAPPPAEFPSGWRLPQEPDLVVPMSNTPYTVAADGVIEYQYFVADPHLTEGRYIDAAECRPDNHAVVHHINVFVLPPELDTGNLTRDDLAEMWELQHHMLCGYVPGMLPTEFPDGMAKYVAPGSKFVFQMHYTPNGSVQQDLSSLGLVFAPRDAERREVTTTPAMNNWFVIPPHEADHVVKLDYKIKRDTEVLSFLPHMHLRGKSFRYVAHYPDGADEVLLDVPHYDFKWQNRYVLANPLMLPAGTVVECIATFDNSEDNLSNPDPTAEVHWGEQSWEEMMIGYFDVVAGESDPVVAGNDGRSPLMLVALACAAVAAAMVLVVRRRRSPVF